MAFEKVKEYWVSDDFERFYWLIRHGQTVIFTHNKIRGKFISGGRWSFGMEKYSLKAKFRKWEIRFIDPQCTFNAELSSVTAIEPECFSPFHVTEKGELTYARGRFLRMADLHKWMVDTCGNIVDKWDFTIDRSL